MEQLSIQSHTPEGWRLYADTFGFVPDPMILRAGEIFLNGASGGAKLQRNLFSLWEALEQNILAVVEFFDMVANARSDSIDQLLVHLRSRRSLAINRGAAAWESLQRRNRL